MQFEQAKNPTWQNLNQWRMELPDGRALMLDPANGETLDPAMPPEWIRDDPMLAEGFQFLIANQGNVNLSVLFNRHGQANDLGNVEQGWFEQQVQGSDAYAFENFGWVRADYLKSLGNFAITGQKPRFTSDAEGKDSSFQMRVWNAVATTRTRAFSFDVENDGSEIGQMNLELAEKWIDAMEHRPDSMTVDEKDWMHVHNNFREWYMVGKLGYELKRIFGETLGRQINVFLTVGAIHRDLPRKMTGAGVNVKASTARSPRFSGMQEDMLSGVFSSSIIPAEARRGVYRSTYSEPSQPTPTRPAPAPERPAARTSGTVGDVGARVKGNAESLPLDGVAASMAAVDARIGELYGKMAMAPDEEREGLQAKINQLMSARAYLGEAFAGLSQSRDAMEQVLDNMGLDWRVEGY